MATENRKPAAAGGRESAGRRAGLPAGTRSSALRNPTVGQSPPGLQVARAGSFRSLEHATTGRAIVLRRPAGALALLPNGPAVGLRCQAEVPPECPREVALIEEACLVRDLRKLAEPVIETVRGTGYRLRTDPRAAPAEHGTH